ncbi:cytokine receptor-like factor 2 [Tenrec ecaudatus]|uniref:cytokine receptor-like factor 2 n=1 Tax=Tenrec ecaudatus TaxID=94439 RepID=UPI003F5A10B4
MGLPAAVAAAAALLILPGRLVTSDDSKADPLVNLQFINFDYDSVHVTWNDTHPPSLNLTFSYRFNTLRDMLPCPRYILVGGRTAGCVLDMEGQAQDRDVMLHATLWEDGRSLLNSSVWISDYLKPSTTKGLHFRWEPEAVTVTCLDLPYGGLLYEIQYRSRFDSAWQSVQEEKCQVTIESLDMEKCYSFRGRVQTRTAYYGSQAHPSDWSAVTHWQQGRPTGGPTPRACTATAGPGPHSATSFTVTPNSSAGEGGAADGHAGQPSKGDGTQVGAPVNVQRPRRAAACPQEKPAFPTALVTVGVVSLFTLCVILTLVRVRFRVRRLLLPSVPDPKFSFPRLFEDHRGNLQEWPREPEEERPSPVEVQEVPPAKPAPRPHSALQEACAPRPPGTPPHPNCGDVVTLGGFSFVMGDNAYVVL